GRGVPVVPLPNRATWFLDLGKVAPQAIREFPGSSVWRGNFLYLCVRRLREPRVVTILWDASGIAHESREGGADRPWNIEIPFNRPGFGCASRARLGNRCKQEAGAERRGGPTCCAPQRISYGTPVPGRNIAVRGYLACLIVVRAPEGVARGDS